MKINWFTLIAQVVNFLVLMWLLKRYLYKPILNAIDERENKIVAQLKDAETKKEEAEKAREDFNIKNKKFDLQKKELMQKVILEGNEVALKLKDKARMDADSLSGKLEEEVRETYKNQNLEISKRVQKEVISITRKTLEDLADASLEEQTIHTFLKKINELKEDEKKKLSSALLSGEDPILVLSAFELSAKQKGNIQQVINDLLGEERGFEFKIGPKLIGGIELSSNGYKLPWSISEYLNSLEKSISESMIEYKKTPS